MSSKRKTTKTIRKSSAAKKAPTPKRRKKSLTELPSPPIVPVLNTAPVVSDQPPLQPELPGHVEPGSRMLGIPKVILLRDPEFRYDEERTKVTAIIGLCTEPIFDTKGTPIGLCPNKREIHPQDAFQVKRCIPHQKREQSRKVAARRKASRAAVRSAKQIDREEGTHVGQP